MITDWLCQRNSKHQSENYSKLNILWVLINYSYRWTYKHVGMFSCFPQLCLSSFTFTSASNHTNNLLLGQPLSSRCISSLIIHQTPNPIPTLTHLSSQFTYLHWKLHRSPLKMTYISYKAISIPTLKIKLPKHNHRTTTWNQALLTLQEWCRFLSECCFLYRGQKSCELYLYPLLCL